KKTSCPISRAQFRSKARPVSITIGDRSFVATTKEFSTGSLGWNLNEKITLEIDGVHVPIQVGLNLTVVGSKELPAHTGTPPPPPSRCRSPPRKSPEARPGPGRRHEQASSCSRHL